MLPGESVSVTAVFEGSGHIALFNGFSNGAPHFTDLGPVTSGVPKVIGPINDFIEVHLTVQDSSGNFWGDMLRVDILTAPVISLFKADPATIAVGGSTTLYWSITGYPDTARIDPLGPIDASGSAVTVNPASTTSYVLTTTNRAGTSTATVEVTVINPLGSFTASAPSTTLGGQVELRATFRGTGELLKDLANGNFESLGGIASGVSLSSGPLFRNTRFRLRVSGDGMTVTQDLVVLVTGPGTFESVPQPDGVQEAVAMPDGRVFVATERQAYFFDPSTKSFAPGPALEQFQVRRLAVLADGRVLIISVPGTNSASVGHVYDPGTGAVRNAGTLSGTESEFATQAITLLDGRVVVWMITRPFPAFGAPGYVIFDPTTESFGSLVEHANFNGTRVTPLADGRALFILPPAGGELFTPGSPGTFAPSRATFLVRPNNYATALLPDGRVFINGGDVVLGTTAELYDPTTDTVSLGGRQLSGNPAFQRAAVVPSGKVLVIGASDATALLYHPAAGTFTQTGGLQTPRTAPAMVRLLDGRVLVVGGACIAIPCAAEIYTP